MATLKTPGVYVQEITKFPPSVAPVATAIPAFIGYTEKAEQLNGDTLALEPVRITSLLEYETYFGGAQKETTLTVTVADKVSNGVPNRSIKVNKPTTPSPYLMYYSLQMYFANGGGPCYITSVGDYSSGSVVLGSLTSGLAAVKKEDEPTLLLFPDATNLADSNDFYALCNDSLTQANQLQDRFVIMDTYGDGGTAIDDLRTGVSLGKDYLKYGAAYYPYLDTILDYSYDKSTTIITHTSNDSQVLTSHIASAQAASSQIAKHLTDSVQLLANFNVSDVASQAGGAAESSAERANQLTFGAGVLDALNGVVSTGASVASSLGTAATAADEDAPTSAAAILAQTNLNAALNTPANPLQTLITDFTSDLADVDAAGNDLDRKAASAAIVLTIASIEAVIQAILDLVDPISIDAISAAQAVDTDGILNGLSLANIETADNVAYNAITTAINSVPITLPPSSAMAGIYARVDNNVGVWKAPANVGVSYVVKPTVQISQEEQGDMNVTSSGKSVNAIRTFTGKGTLVWGARTLAGNDNEWRYVPVRRFFNFVEESVSEASEQFVFEPNDGNTWVRIRGMIENFLTQQWKAGALAGAKPSQAFYVRVGLGSTMTAQDILEGRMIIEIGMAAVRPAEFIVLRFSHKMQES